MTINMPSTVFLAAPHAFCASVERAIEIVERALEDHTRTNGTFSWFHPELPRDIPIRGSVCDVSGIRIENVTLTLVEMSRRVDQCLTRSDGRYSVLTRNNGAHLLIASAIGYQSRASMISVDSRPIFMNIMLAGGCKLTGTIRQNRSAEVTSALVTLMNSRTRIVSSMTTDHDGKYIFKGLTPGDYQLYVKARGRTPLWSQVVVSQYFDVHHDITFGNNGRYSTQP